MYVIYQPKGDLIHVGSQTRNRYLGLGTPCSSCNSVMRSPLKEKIYNAISRAIQDTKLSSDCGNKGDGALIVGGRRRNRKKRNKKNGQKKKKTGSLESIKSRLSPKGCRKGDSQDSSPLIVDTEDSREQQKDVEDFQERQHTEEHGVKAEHEVRDTAAGEGQDWQEEEHGLIEADRIQQNNAAVVSETEDLVQLELTTSSSFLRHDPDSQPSTETPWLYSVSKVIQVTHLEPPVKLDDVDLKEEEEQTVVKSIADPNSSQVEPMQVESTSAVKSEASPLIDKDEAKDDQKSLKGRDSKFKDQQPGLPCCTIL